MSNMTYMLDIPAIHMQNIFGRNDQYILKLEKDLKVTIVDRNGSVKITGEEANVKQAVNILNQLMELSKRGNEIE